MAEARVLVFDNFRLDPVNECLRRGEQVIQLTPKAFALLRYLAERPQQMVTKDELLKAVWPEVIVSEGVLTTHIGVLRQALGDNAKAPRYIETVHRRGYRFIAPLNPSPPVVSSQLSVVSSDEMEAVRRPPLGTSNWQLTTPLVGREAELAQLHSLFAKALQGERQIVFVVGEAGIGKTTVVDAFVARAAAEQDIWLGQGQCIEQFGAGEAYLPVLAAFGQLGRETRGQRLVEMLSQHAPTWLMQLPALLNPADLDTLQRKTQGATRERMLREMAEALEALTANQLLVLTLEDLHWSDPSTLELLSFLARRRQPARLLVLGTYRPVEVLANGHPLRAVTQELQLHRHCEELPLRLLTDNHIVEYLTARFIAPSSANAGEKQGEGLSPVNLRKLARLIHRRTEGNPLFMVTIVEDLLVRGTLDKQAIEVSAPTTIQQLIERQFDHLTPAEQQILEVASVAGAEFSAAAVAAGIESDTAEIETHCADLARREQFLRRSRGETWPDGTLATCYRFHHALYQEVVYERVAVSRRSVLHHRIGERLEVAYQERVSEVAAELAVHFERGQDYQRAVQYLQHAGENAIQRSAHVEAITHFTKGLELLKTLPDTRERAQQELTLQLALGAPLIATKGYAAQEVGTAYTRARELCQQLGETPQLFPVLWGLSAFHTVRAEYKTARELREHMLRLAQNVQDQDLLMEAHAGLGVVLFYLGELALARAYLEQRIALDDPLQHHALTILYSGVDPGVRCLSYTIATLWLLGYPTQALKMSHETLALARELSHPFSLSMALHWVTMLHQFRREEQTVQERAEALITLCREKEIAG
ncbi:MAG: AAA family ATPase, partial [Deltaproteobacteria bacterium]|nr:AAA family ATPase [Deltaproteobacteria bacterium]